MKSFPPWLKIALAVIILSGLWLRVETYAHRELTVDEFTEYKAGLGELKPFWTRVYYGELHSFPGDYLVTYPFIHLFHKNKWGLTIPHFIATLLGFYALWLLCRKYFKNPWSWVITFSIFAMHRELIFHSLGLRPYSVLITLGLSTFYILDYLVDPLLSLSILKRFMFWCILLLTIVYHPYGIFILGCCGLFILLRDWRKNEVIALVQRQWLFGVSLIIVGCSLWLYYLKGNPLCTPQSIQGALRDVFQYIPNPTMHPWGFFKSVLGNLIGSKLGYILSLGILARLLWPKNVRLDLWGFATVLIVLPILITLFSDVTYGYWFLQRQYVWSIPLYSFFTGLCWDDLLSLPR